jgi:integrase
MGNLAAEQAEQATPPTVNPTVRTREYLTQREIDKLMDAARSGSRYGHRDSTMILIAYRHGLRASELCDLQWSQVDFNAGTLRVRRRKQGSPGTHPLQGDEIRALRRLQRGTFVFLTERDGPMTPKAFHALFARIGQRAELPFPVHPHMLRHATGYALANRGTDTRTLQAYQLVPTTQKPLPNGSLQNAMGGREPPSNFCSHFAPALIAFAKKVSKSST